MHVRLRFTRPGSDGANDGLNELYELRSRCSQLEEQVEQQQKVIRYLQANGGNSADRRLQQLQDENEDLKQKVAVLQADLEAASTQRPGTSGMSSALRQQVLALQVITQCLQVACSTENTNCVH